MAINLIDKSPIKITVDTLNFDYRQNLSIHPAQRCVLNLLIINSQHKVEKVLRDLCDNLHQWIGLQAKGRLEIGVFLYLRFKFSQTVKS